MKRCIHCNRTEQEARFPDFTDDACNVCLSPDALRSRIDRLPDGPMKATMLSVGLAMGLVEPREGDVV